MILWNMLQQFQFTGRKVYESQAYSTDQIKDIDKIHDRLSRYN